MRPIDKLKIKIALTTVVIPPHIGHTKTGKVTQVEGSSYERRKAAILHALKNRKRPQFQEYEEPLIREKRNQLQGWRDLGISSAEIRVAAEDMVAQEDEADRIAFDEWGRGFDFALTETVRAAQMHASGQALSNEQAELVQKINMGLDELKAWSEDFRNNVDPTSGQQGVRLFNILGIMGSLGQEALRKATGKSKEEWEAIFNWEGAKNVQLAEELADFEPDYDKAALIALLLLLQQIHESESDES